MSDLSEIAANVNLNLALENCPQYSHVYKAEINRLSSGDVYSYRMRTQTDLHLRDFTRQIREATLHLAKNTKLVFHSSPAILFEDDTKLAVLICHSMFDDGLSEQEDGRVMKQFDIDIVGEDQLACRIYETLQTTHPSRKMPVICWQRLTSDGKLDETRIYLDESRKVYDSFYPWIRGGVDAYVQRFLKSESTILILIGPPGTGKTSLIRYMIAKNDLKGIVTYDEELIASDQLFSRFLVGGSDMLVLEDADVILAPRTDGNKLIARFLNTAQGLVRMPKKKMIFSTNLEQVSDIDEAMTRPGRCFDVMTMRPLTGREAEAVARDVGITADVEYDDGIMLSEVFNVPQNAKPRLRKVGF